MCKRPHHYFCLVLASLRRKYGRPLVVDKRVFARNLYCSAYTFRLAWSPQLELSLCFAHLQAGQCCTRTIATGQTLLMAPTPNPTWCKAADVVPDFDPSQHLVGNLPANKLSMEDLGLPNDIGVSPFAVSDLFQLFSAEAVEIMRKEIFGVPDRFKFRRNIAECQLRGYTEQ